MELSSEEEEFAMFQNVTSKHLKSERGLTDIALSLEGTQDTEKDSVGGK